MLQAGLDVETISCSSLSAAVPADEILLGFLLLSCTLVFQSASVRGLTSNEFPACSNTLTLPAIIKHDKYRQNMAKGLLGGMTDYSHQSFNDIITDLQKEQTTVTDFINGISANIEKVKASGYWDKKVSSDFAQIIGYSLKHFKTTNEELSEIAQEIQIEVRKHHCKRLEKIAMVADEINSSIGTIWHQRYNGKEYGNPEFVLVEDIYGDTRDMAVNLLDISNIASRLKDFIGKTKIIMEKNQNLGGISHTTFGDNATIIVGDHNQVKTIQIKQGNFDDLSDLLKRNNVSDEDISELKNIVENETPDTEKKTLGSKTNGWISKMVGKCLDGSWAIGIGAAGKLLADGIKAYYGWHI